LLNEHLLAGLFVEVIHASAQLFFDVLPTRWHSWNARRMHECLIVMTKVKKLKLHANIYTRDELFAEVIIISTRRMINFDRESASNP
jgi:hypothetical protein